MNHHSPPSSIYDNWRGLLITFGKIILRIIGAGLAMSFGFWLIMASNMGPAYLPHLMNGALDFWIRMILLGLGQLFLPSSTLHYSCGLLVAHYGW